MTTENTTPNPDDKTPPVDDAAAKAAAAGLTADPALNINTDGKTPAKEEKTPPAKDGKEPPAKVEPVVYDPSGDAGLDMLLEAAGGLGLTRDHPAMQAAVKGDFNLLAVELEKGDVKGAGRLIHLGEKAYADMASKVKARQVEDLKAVHKEVGGEENWNAIRAWANENADDTEKKEISAALTKGGLAARMAASWLASNYNRAGNVNTEGAGPKVADGKGNAGSSGALSPREYAKAVAEARVGFKGDFENSEVYRNLQARRRAYRP